MITKRWLFRMAVGAALPMAIASSSVSAAASASILASSSSSSSEPRIVTVQASSDHHNHHHHSHDRRQLQSSNPVPRAEVYECDEFHNPITDVTTPRPFGYTIQICIRPDAPTRARDVRMRSIDSFTFYKGNGAGGVQNVIENRQELTRELPGTSGTNDDSNSNNNVNEIFLTLNLCIPGKLVCSFKTQLMDDFFYAAQAGNLTGQGTVSLQFFDEDEESQPVNNGNAITGESSGINGVFNGYAGSDSVIINIPIVGVDRPKVKKRDTKTDGSSWWASAPWWLKMLILLAIIIVILMGCCLCGMCWQILHDTMEDDEQQQPQQQQQQSKRNATSKSQKGDSTSFQSSEEGDETTITSSTIVSPTEADVCFESENHPGTIAMENVVQEVAELFKHQDFSSRIYQRIKKQLANRKYFVCDTCTDDTNERTNQWRHVTARAELHELIKLEFETIQQELRETMTDSSGSR